MSIPGSPIICEIMEDVMRKMTIPPGFKDIPEFSFVEALLGRRSRRFFMGAEIPDGVFSFKSRHEEVPLSELEKLLVLAACGANTGWNNLIYRAQRYAPHLSNYAAAAGGRTFPSAAGFHTSMTFFTDDEGLYVLDDRDASSFVNEDKKEQELETILTSLQGCIRKLHDGRLRLPSETPYVEAHNTWVVNKPGTLLVIPVGDMAQHVLLNLCYMLQNGLVLTDDINGCAIPGIEKFSHLVDVENVWPITFVEQWSLSELSAELATSCYAGTLMLQTMGLGGWMFNGIDPFAMLGASEEPEVPGLGFRYDVDDQWPYPNVTGLSGVMEGFCPPHYANMSEAVEAVCERKFGEGGPFHKDTPGPWKESAKVRAAAEIHSQDFKDCVSLQAEYVFETFGKFPGTVPSIFVMQYLQAHHLDLDFYDEFYKPGAYLDSHASHMKLWHGKT